MSSLWKSHKAQEKEKQKERYTLLLILSPLYLPFFIYINPLRAKFPTLVLMTLISQSAPGSPERNLLIMANAWTHWTSKQKKVTSSGYFSNKTKSLTTSTFSHL